MNAWQQLDNHEGCLLSWILKTGSCPADLRKVFEWLLMFQQCNMLQKVVRVADISRYGLLTCTTIRKKILFILLFALLACIRKPALNNLTIHGHTTSHRETIATTFTQRKTPENSYLLSLKGDWIRNWNQ
jgi:hypothetical protein